MDVDDVSDRVTVIEVHGQADLHTASELRGAIGDAIDRGAVYLVVDLSEATFIDSMTLGVLLGAVKRLRPAGGSRERRLHATRTSAASSRSPCSIASSRCIPIGSPRSTERAAGERLHRSRHAHRHHRRRVSRDEGYRSVGRLVLGGLASRFELPVDRVEDLLLAVESLLVHGVAGETVTLDGRRAARTRSAVRLGPLASAGVADPAVARVLDRSSTRRPR